jgi:hypothetical protein
MDAWQENNFSVFKFSDRAAASATLSVEATIEANEKKRKRTEENAALKKQVVKLKETNERRTEKIVEKRHAAAEDKQEFSKRLKAIVVDVREESHRREKECREKGRQEKQRQKEQQRQKEKQLEKELKQKHRAEKRAREEAADKELKVVIKAARVEQQLLQKELHATKKKADRVSGLESQLQLVLRCKRHRVASGTWDGRKQLVHRLTPAQRQRVAKQWVGSRIYDKGYTEGTNKYNPQIILKFNTSLSTNKEMLQTLWHWWLDEDSVPDRLQHRTHLSRVIKGRADLTLSLAQDWLSDPDIASFVCLIDASERAGETFTPVLVTFSSKSDVHAML